MHKRVAFLFFAELILLFTFGIFTTFAAGKKLNPWDEKKDGSCKMGSVCKGIISADAAKKITGVHPAGVEGNRTDYRDANGNFAFAVLNPKKEKEKPEPKGPAPTATPTPTPTPNPTATPTPNPTATATPTPTPQPPRVVVIREIPKKLPPTGFPTDSVAAGAVITGSFGWWIIRRFRA